VQYLDFEDGGRFFGGAGVEILLGGGGFFGGAGDANPLRILNFCNICPLVQKKNLPL